MEFGVDRPWVVYVGPFSYPDGGAAAQRILGNCLSLTMSGYDVLIASGQTSEDGDLPRATQPGIWLLSMQERDSEHLPRAMRLLRYVSMGSRTRKWLDKITPRPAAVIIYSGYSPYLLQFTAWGRKNRVPVIFDAVEWYTARSVAHFISSPYLWNIELAMRSLIKRANGVIGISSYLTNYYRRAGLPVAQIPPTLDTANVPYRLDSNISEKLVLTYSGSGGKGQDQLDAVIEAVLRLDPNGSRMVLNIAGPTEEDIAKLPALSSWAGKAKTLPAALRVHGRITHMASLELMRNADFTVFPRKQNRVTSAGFPTKFVESFSCGTPVISTITSDLANYLIDGDTGFISSDASADSIVLVLEKAALLSNSDHQRMRLACRTKAVQVFDYRSHAKNLRKLIEACAALV